MLSKNIKFENFELRKKLSDKKKKIFKNLRKICSENNEILHSLSDDYKDSFTKKYVNNLNKIKNMNIIGMGGSILGAKAIYSFLKPKQKKINFYDNYSYKNYEIDKKKKISLIISKSGNTLETICNSNIIIKKSDTKIFVTENKKSYLMDLANKLKAKIIYHNNFIGGRYSVLSEVGMLPAQLMGFKPEKFRKFNQIIKNSNFVNILVTNIANILSLIKNKKSNSIIINYDEDSNDLFRWYQQLIAESLGKKSKGILPIISNMPQDNHSLMQYYLDGVKNHFFTLFFVNEKNSKKLKNSEIFESHNYLYNKSLNQISFSQFVATKKVFKDKNIPHRSFVIKNKSEETLGELFTFFILETILLGMAMKIDPYNQPEVELIKRDTKSFLKKN